MGPMRRWHMRPGPRFSPTSRARDYVRTGQITEELGIPDSTLSDHLTVTKPQDYSPRANLSTIKDLIVPLSVQ